MKEIATFEDVDEVLRCNFDTGFCYWKKRTSNRVRVGDVAGYKSPDGRMHITVNGRTYRAHRIVWLLKIGEWPTEEIDHIDGDPSNNRFGNLRDVDHRTNSKNTRRSPRNTSGTNGVSWCSERKKWTAYINDKNGKQIPLGRFVNKKDAIAVRKAEEVELGYQKNHGRD